MITITGLNEVTSKLASMGTTINPVVEEATHRAMDRVEDLAMKDLESQLGSGRWGGAWSHGDKQIHIGDAWEHSKGTWIASSYISELTNKSKHAAAVEFGVPGLIKPKTASYLYLGDGTYKRWVRGQAGYHYLTNAIEKTDELHEIYSKMVRDFLHYYSV